MPVSPNAYIKDVSTLLTQTRRQAGSFHAFPGAMPNSLAQAYAIQMHSIDLWPETPAGWKIGGIAPSMQESLGQERLVGPIFPSSIKHVANQSRTHMPIYDQGFAALEAEFIYILGQDLAPGSRLKGEALLDTIEAMHIGIEIASSPLQAINTMGPLAVVSDFGNNAGLLIGPPVETWRNRSFSDLTVSTTIDGEQVGKNTADVLAGGPLRSLEFLIGHCAAHDITLPAGTAVTTGAVSGVHQIHAGQHGIADFGAHGQLEVDVMPMQPF